MTYLSLLCPSYRPKDLKNWLDSLYRNCSFPKEIELSLTLEEPMVDDRWGRMIVTYVKPKQYNINQLVEICYKQSTSHYVFLSGDDTICRTYGWDTKFLNNLIRFPDNIVLVYPNDMIFGESLACYPVTTRKIMDSVNWPVPFERYAIDDTIFDIVPYERRIYLPNVIMEHLHLSPNPPGHPVVRDGKVYYYPHDTEAMSRDRLLYTNLQSEREFTRNRLKQQMVGGIQGQTVS